APDGVADLPVPIVAEPASTAWPSAVRTGPWLLGASPALRPAQVVVAGRPTLHRPVQRLLADPDVAVHVLADPRGLPWPDVAGTVRAIGSLPALRPDPAWVDRWRAADAAAADVLDKALDDPAAPGRPRLARELGAGLPRGAPLVLGSPNPLRAAPLAADAAAADVLDKALGDPAAPGGLRLARELVAALPRGAQLVLGSSNPVRDVALAAVPRGDLVVHANRGVAGIDGTVSTAVGAA